jgi:leukotriene-A4 hydrolase
VNFDESVLRGAVIHFISLLADTTELILDTKGQKISSVHSINPDGAMTHSLKYTYGAKHDVFGTPLAISLPEEFTKAGCTLRVRIAYETSPEAEAIQWLPKEQTKGGKYPYLFTQCQAIHCRSLMPTQDTPSNKFTYSATIECDTPLQALMSAQSFTSEAKAASEKPTTIFSFDQPEPIPSYLTALAVGELESRQIGPRSKVWSEHATVDAGAFEFSQTEDFIKAGEAICGPYPWGIYDILLLPPSFPYGGSE